MSIRTPSTAPESEQGGPPREPRYPWQLFVGMLLAIIVVGAILAVALGVNPLTFQKITPGADVTSTTSGSSVIAIAPPTPGLTPLAIPTLAPAVVPTPAPTTAPTPATASAPQTVATNVPTSPAVATPASTSAAAATVPTEATSATNAPTSVTTEQVQPTPVEAAVAPELAAAIIQGYDNYWSVRVRASGDPNDASLDLASVMADGELQAANTTLDQYRQEGIAFRTTVHHQIWITEATASVATVVDKYSGESLRLNLETKQPDGSAPVTQSFADVFTLNNIDGVWKVVSQQPWE